MKTAEWNERQRGASSVSGTGNEWRRAGWWSELRRHGGGGGAAAGTGDCPTVETKVREEKWGPQIGRSAQSGDK